MLKPEPPPRTKGTAFGALSRDGTQTCQEQVDHEEMLFNALNGRDDHRSWERCGGIPTRRSYPECGDDHLIDPEHLEILKKR